MWSRETWEPRAWHRVSPQCIAARCIIETVSLLEVWGQRSPFGQNLKWSSPWISSSSREGPDEWSQHDNHVSCVQASSQHLVPLWRLSWVQGKRGDLSWLRWTEGTFFHPVSKASQLSCMNTHHASQLLLAATVPAQAGLQRSNRGAQGQRTRGHQAWTSLQPPQPWLWTCCFAGIALKWRDFSILWSGKASLCRQEVCLEINEKGGTLLR